MSESNKLLVEILSTVVLPKLKGLSERNAKKIFSVSQKSLIEIAKKYHKLLAEQEKELVELKSKNAKAALKVAEKAQKKKLKLAKKDAKAKKIALLLVKDKPTTTISPSSKSSSVPGKKTPTKSTSAEKPAIKK